MWFSSSLGAGSPCAVLPLAFLEGRKMTAPNSMIDLREIKAKMELDPGDSSDDKILNFIIPQAIEWIEEVLGRKLQYKTRTEYYNGTNNPKLCLRARPVFATVPDPYTDLTVWHDPDGYWGSGDDAFSEDPLTYGTDYALKIDSDDGSSRCGVLVRINGVWEKPAYRQAGYLSAFVGEDKGSIKVTYTAGYTADTVPGALRMAASFLVIRIRRLFPLGYELSSESYEERSISIMADNKHYLLGLIMPMLVQFQNRSWGRS